MTSRNELQDLKTTAKRLARTRRIALHEALEIVAKRLGQPHWNALTIAWEKGWRPEPKALEALCQTDKSIRADVMAIQMVGAGQGVKEEGHIYGHRYSLEIDFEVLMAGDGWCILLGHAPSETPVIEVHNESPDNPILNSEFRSKALATCHEAAEALRARIAVD
jgi:hypothetical protein